MKKFALVHQISYSGPMTATLTNATFSGASITGANITGSNSFGTSSVGTFRPVPSGTIHISGSDPKIITEDGEINLRELIGMMKDIRDRLLIIEENMKRHDDYPALKSIYEQYRVVEALVNAEDD
jgi:hypothetical protein